MKITDDDIDSIDNATPLELFYRGIRNEQTKLSYENQLKYILCDVCENLLNGTFGERAAELVERVRKDPDWGCKLMLKIVMGWSEKAKLDPLDPEYVNPGSIKQYMCTVKKLLDMNDVALPWKRIYATYPEVGRDGDARGWLLSEIQTMLAHTTCVQTKAAILVLASSGMRAGGMQLKWNDINPIYRIGGRLVDGRDAQELQGIDNPVCASVRVYQGSPEEYTTFITPEAYRALMEHAAEHEGKIGRVLKPDDPVFTKKQKYGTPVDGNTMSCWMSRLVQKAGVRNAYTKKSRRYNVPIVHGFRRFWNKTYADNRIGNMPASSLTMKEYMIGHRGAMPMDRNYYQTNVTSLAEEYLHVVDALTIDEVERLRITNYRKDEKIRELEAENDERMREMQSHGDERIERLEAMIQNMAKRLGVCQRHMPSCCKGCGSADRGIDQ